jgi:hypothetical protein
MRFLLGTDEAGYGPNLGPLVVAASAWEAPADLAPENLYDALAEVICRERTNDGDGRLEIADSKQLYQAGGSLAALERGVLALLALLSRKVTCWKDCWPCLVSESPDHWSGCNGTARRFDESPRPLVGALTALPWHDGYDEPLPIAIPVEELGLLAAQLADGLRARRVRLLNLAARVLMPRQFNDQVTAYGNKAEVLSLTTLSLARRLIEELPPGDVLVFCDKHGGRAYYAALLQHVFQAELIIVRQETDESGVYELRLGPVKRNGDDFQRTVTFQFLARGERMLPTALASMTAKYLRELAMRPFNAFWQQHVPGLRPTAGYPTDSRRFLAEIRTTQRRLRIKKRDLWRER